jgi:hypothetical protein
MSFVAGLGLLAFAIEYHFEMVGESCEGCDPAHPLFVLTPLVVGAVLFVGGGVALWRRW